MSYLLDLRRDVGHQPLISTGAATLVYNPQHALLLIHRTDTHLWGLPAGSKELNESLVNTAIREVQEETGVTITTPSLTGLLSGPGMQFTYPNGDQIDAVIAVYTAQTTQQQLTPQPGETDRVAFFLPADLPHQLTDFTHKILVETTTWYE